ncbi:hypothetical protein C0989_001358 [Termitomyces sp. Mn162]|nr:hypothetical protein C0989_001358 [Termitomyces sp. Mn162]
MSSPTAQPANTSAITSVPKKKPHPFWLGGVAATIAASITHPLDLTKVRLQASGDKRMIESIKKTYRTAGARGLFDGISGTWLRQMSYSMCRFWAYDESKKILGAGKDAPAWKLAMAGTMAGGIAGFVGNPGEIVMVRLQGDFAKPPEKRFNYKHCFDALFRYRVLTHMSIVISDGPRGRSLVSRARRWSKRVPSGPDERKSAGLVCTCLLHDHSHLTAQISSYDFFKAELLKTGQFQDNIICHFTASFAAVCFINPTVSIQGSLYRPMRDREPSPLPFARLPMSSRFAYHEPLCLPLIDRTLAQSRIMNASGPGSNVRFVVILSPIPKILELTSL